MKRERGIGLIEIMISLFIASLLLGLIIEHFGIVKHQFYTIQTELEEAMEMNIVEGLLKKSIRNAGFTPCMGLNKLDTYDSRNSSQHLQALNYTNQTLIIKTMSAEYTQLKYQSNLKGLLVPELHFKFPKNNTILIADCYQAEVHVIKKIVRTAEGYQIYLKKPLIYDFREPVYLGEWIEEQFYIHENKHHNRALFFKKNKAEEISSLINELTVISHQNLIEIELGSKSKKSLSIRTLIRTPQ